MATVGRLQVKVSADAGDLVTGLSRASESVSRFASGVRAIGAASASAFATVGRSAGTAFAGVTRGVADVARHMAEIGKGAAEIGIKAAEVGLAGAVVAGASFERQMQKVKGITGASGEAMAGMKDQVRDLAGKTVFGPTEVAKGLTLLTKSGMDAGRALQALPSLLDMATIGDIEMAKAADIGAQTMQQFHLQGREMSRVADVLAKASKTSTTTIAELAEALNYAGPTAEAAGMDLEQTAAALASLAEMGIRGTAAGTALKNVFTSFAAPSDKAAQMMKTLGIDAMDAEGNFKPLPVLIDQLAASMRGLPTGDKTTAIAEIFGKRNTAPINALLGFGGARLRNYEDVFRHSGGIAHSMAGTFTDNTADRATMFKNRLEVLGTRVFETIQPILERLITGAEALARVLAGSVRPALDGIASVFKQIGGSGGLGNIFAGVVGPLALLAPGLMPFSLALAGVGALAVKLGPQLAEAFAPLSGLAEKVLPALVRIGEGVVAFAGKTIKMVGSVLDETIKSFTDKTGGYFANDLAGLGKTFRSIAAAGKEAFENIGFAMEHWKDTAELVALQVQSFFVRTWENMKNFGENLTDNMVTWVDHRLNAMARNEKANAQFTLNTAGDLFGQGELKSRFPQLNAMLERTAQQNVLADKPYKNLLTARPETAQEKLLREEISRIEKRMAAQMEAAGMANLRGYVPEKPLAGADAPDWIKLAGRQMLHASMFAGAGWKERGFLPSDMWDAMGGIEILSGVKDLVEAVQGSPIEAATRRLPVAMKELAAPGALTAGSKEAYSAVAAFERSGYQLSDPQDRAAKAAEDTAKKLDETNNLLAEQLTYIRTGPDQIKVVEF